MYWKDSARTGCRYCRQRHCVNWRRKPAARSGRTHFRQDRHQHHDSRRPYDSRCYRHRQICRVLSRLQRRLNRLQHLLRPGAREEKYVKRFIHCLYGYAERTEPHGYHDQQSGKCIHSRIQKEGSTSQSFNSILAYKLKDSSVGLGRSENIGANTPGVKIGENYTDYTQGSFRVTGNTFDLALTDSGFFAVEFTNKAGETSTKYTRAGNFTLNKDGYLVTGDGDYVLDTANRRIKLDPLKESAVLTDGTITQDGTHVAKIQIADFENYDYLTRYGETYFEPVEGAKSVASRAEIQSGYLEMANVQVVSEMVNMISITRQYESNQKILQTYDSSLEIAVKELGKV